MLPRVEAEDEKENAREPTGNIKQVEDTTKELCTDPSSGTGSQSSKREVGSYVMFRM